VLTSASSPWLCPAELSYLRGFQWALGTCYPRALYIFEVYLYGGSPLLRVINGMG